MKVVFLGTNGWYTSPTGNTPCILIDSKDRYVIFDAGNGIYKLDQYITENKPISMFISHFHLDHVSGLHTLSKFNFPQGIDIYVGKGRAKDFDTLVYRPFTIGIKQEKENIANFEMDVRLHELEDGENSIGFSVFAFKLQHAYTDHGYRVRLEDKIIAYSGDTGICPNSYLMAENADLLIHECSWMEVPNGSTWGHVTPTLVANLAKDANVKKLALNHFDASKFTTLEKRKEAEKIAQAIFPNTIAAHDDLVIEL